MRIQPQILPKALRETALLFATAVAITLLLSIPDARFWPDAHSQNWDLIIPLTIIFYIWLRPLSFLPRLPKIRNEILYALLVLAGIVILILTVPFLVRLILRLPLYWPLAWFY